MKSHSDFDVLEYISRFSHFLHLDYHFKAENDSPNAKNVRILEMYSRTSKSDNEFIWFRGIHVFTWKVRTFALAQGTVPEFNTISASSPNTTIPCALLMILESIYPPPLSRGEVPPGGPCSLKTLGGQDLLFTICLNALQNHLQNPRNR